MNEDKYIMPKREEIKFLGEPKFQPTLEQICSGLEIQIEIGLAVLDNRKDIMKGFNED